MLPGESGGHADLTALGRSEGDDTNLGDDDDNDDDDNEHDDDAYDDDDDDDARRTQYRPRR